MENLSKEVKELYTRYSPKMESYFVKRVATEDDADDLVQEVFILYFKKRKDGITITNISTWFRRSSYFVLQNYLHHSWTRLVECNETIVLRLFDKMSPFYTVCEVHFIIEEILYNKFKELERSIFLLIGVYCYTRKEISRALQIHPKRVSRCYDRSCRIFRNSLQEKGIYNFFELYGSDF